MLTILAVNEFCPDFSEKLKSTLAAALSLTSAERDLICSTMVPVMDSIFTLTPLRKLPGATELTDGSASTSKFVAFVLDRVSAVSDSASRLEAAKAKYYALDGSRVEDSHKLLAQEETLFGTCTSWKGRPFIDAADRAQFVISIVPDIVRAEFALNRLDFLSVDFHWSKFASRLHEVWKDALDKQRILQPRASSSKPTALQVILGKNPQRVKPHADFMISCSGS